MMLNCQETQALHVYRNIKIRVAHHDDAPMLAHLIHQARQGMHSYYTEKFLEQNLPADEPEDYQALMKKREIFVAEQDGRIVGTAALKGISLGMFFVDIDMQGNGIGHALLDHIEILATQRRIPFLLVHASLNAVSFYQSRGFFEVRPEISHAHFPAMFMQKRLPSTEFALLYYASERHGDLSSSLRKGIENSVFSDMLGNPQELFVLENSTGRPVALIGGVVTYDFLNNCKGFEAIFFNVADGVTLDQIFSISTVQLALTVFYTGGRNLSFHDVKLQQKMNEVLKNLIKGSAENKRFFMSENKPEDFTAAA